MGSPAVSLTVIMLQVLSIQEICVQMSVSQLSQTAANMMTSYETHLKQSLGETKFSNLNLSRTVYPCAAVVAAAKLRGEKIDQGKVADLSRVKKKDLLEIVEEMIKIQPKQDKSSVKRNLDLMDKIMGTGEEEGETSAAAVVMTKREKIQEEDFEDDGYEEWKDAMIRKVVDQGFTQYKKYLKSSG